MTTPKNILIVTQCFPPDVGGIETMMGNLAKACTDAGHRVTVLADGREGPAPQATAYTVRRLSGFKPLRRWRKGLAANRAIRSGGVDIVIADSWKSAEFLSAKALTDGGSRLVVLAHGMEFPQTVSAKKAARIRSALSKADAVLANSRYTGDLCAPYARSDTLRVVTPPILPQPDAPPARVETLRQAYGGDFNVLTLCRLEPRKGVDRLIEALAALKPSFPALKLHVAGSGPDRERLAALAKDLGVTDAVVFHGRVSDEEKAALYGLAEVFAMPARRDGSSVEGFGLVYLEAGWYGAPAVAGRDGGAQDAVLDGETGLLCDGASAGDIAAALRRLIADPSLRERMSEAAARHARAQVWSIRLAEYLADGGDAPSSSPRILQLLPALGDGGVERSAVEMAGFLSAKGLENWIASAGGPLVAQAEALGAKHAEIAVGSKSPFGMIAAARAVARLIDEQAIDIVHARSRAPAWAALTALKLARRKARYVTTFHGVYSHGNALKRFYNGAMLRARVVIANSLFIRDHIVSVYGYPAERIVVAPRGVEPEIFDPAAVSPERRAEVRGELGGSPERPLVVMVGRVTGWKGHAVLLDAFARLERQDADLAFIGGGGESVVAELKDRAAALGLQTRVRFAGSRRDIPTVLAAADLAVSASTRPEAFGRAAIEAQAMGVPVVATDHGGSRETVVAGETGWLVPPGNADAMAKAIGEALADPARRAEMGRKGRENVLAHFTTQAMLEKEFSAYMRLLALPERP